MEMLNLIDSVSWPIVLVLVATLGLAPFVPEPHIWEKLKMLVSGTLVKPMDIFDFLMHGVPWALLLAKLVRMLTA